MKRANEVPVGTVGIGYGCHDLVFDEVFTAPRGRCGTRINGTEIMVYLVAESPVDVEELRQLCRVIAASGMFGTCSSGVELYLFKRDLRTDDVQMLDRWEYRNPKEEA